MSGQYLTLFRDENQARGIGRYAIDFLAGSYPEPDPAALAKVEQFHTDSIACGVAALGLGMNAPTLLRQEALTYEAPKGHFGATCLGSAALVRPEKAVVANCSAVRELDANGTNFGYNPWTGAAAGEYGHNDYYGVPIAATQMRGLEGRQVLQGMLCMDEIRGRLAEVFALKNHKIDHVVHGAIASTAVYAAMSGASAEQIESAIGMVVAHYVPFRAIRAGRQLSDSQGASAAFSAEVAVLSAERAMSGFVGPADIFRNPQALFCLFEPPEVDGQSPFDLILTTDGEDFAVQGMHFKLGLYEHQSAGAIQGLINVLSEHPEVLDDMDAVQKIRIAIYEPALSIIGDPAKRDPRTRQSADHSMVYIIATLLRKAFAMKSSGWRELMLMPADYDQQALFDPLTRRLMDRIEFVHGGPDFDADYPEGIPTQLDLEHAKLGTLSSGRIRYPLGHAQNFSGKLKELLQHKFHALASLGVPDPEALHQKISQLAGKSVQEIRDLYTFELLGGPFS